MSETFLDAAAERAIDAAAHHHGRPLPTDDALAALELHGSVFELGAGEGIWMALLRKRKLVPCVCYDRTPLPHTYAHVLAGGEEMAAQHADRTLLLVRGSKNLDLCVALDTFLAAGGSTVAYVGAFAAAAERNGERCDGLFERFKAALQASFDRNVTVALPGSNKDLLTIWRRKLTGAQQCGVLDVRLELVDMEAPDWAAAPKPPGSQGPEMVLENGGRTIRPAMDRAAFEAALPDDF